MSDGTPNKDQAALRIEGLTIQLPNGRKLLEDTSLVVPKGELLLLVGPSGSGKSTLLSLVAGLSDQDHNPVQVTGDVLVDPGDDGKRRKGRVGLVFQSHALFDELTAQQNVQLAVDHRPGGRRGKADEARARLEELDVRPDIRPSVLSGGEKQRVAVARTLAMDATVLLFDEPTTGLDPARIQDVVRLILQTHRRHKKTVVVVTHDFEPFLECDPRIVMLDPTSRQLRDVTVDDIEAELSTLTTMASTETPIPTGPSTSRRWTQRLFEEPGRALIFMLSLFPAILGSWHRPRWKSRYLGHYLKMVAGPSTAIYVTIAGTMLGYTFVNFTFAQIPYADVTVPLLKEEFLAATGYSTFRVIVPLLIAVLVAGKCGASIAADVGSRRYANQFDALRNCGASPWHYLCGNIALSLLLAVPLLTVLAFVANGYASMVAFLSADPEGTIAMFMRNYFATVWPDDRMFPVGSGWVTLKMSASGLIVAGLSYAIGSRPKASPADVSRDVGLTIFWSSLTVLLLHSVFSRIEF
ncbi:MAG: ATP-binding cassette domain-containing protein [Phycisphaerae bacterium]